MIAYHNIAGGIIMQNYNNGEHPEIRDYGPNPFIFNIDHATNMNNFFRTTLWTGQHMQLTLMSIPEGNEIGVEMHSNVDQFIRIENGIAKVFIGDSDTNLREVGFVNDDFAIIIPAGTWHNIVNIWDAPLKVYSLYAPPQHDAGTIHKTKEDAKHEH